MNVKLEKATIDKIAELQQLCREAYEGNFANHWINRAGMLDYLDHQFNKTRLTKEISSKGRVYYFIKNKEESVGFIKVNMAASWDIFKSSNLCELEKIYMRPSQKGIGIGKLALSQLVAICQDEGKHSMYLCVLETNTSSIAFYKKNKFIFHSKTVLDASNFKKELKGMDVMLRML